MIPIRTIEELDKETEELDREFEDLKNSMTPEEWGYINKTWAKCRTEGEEERKKNPLPEMSAEEVYLMLFPEAEINES